MLVEVISNVNEARSEDMTGKTVLVIDVLRATSNMVTALAHGCRGILPVETVQQAKSMREADILLGGERNCRMPAGFDLGNSPFEYMEERIAGKRICMTTTNGTRAIQKTQRAHKVFACSLLNVAACAEAALAAGRDICILCAGTQDAFAHEDGLCAGMAVDELQRAAGGAVECNDFGLAMHAAYSHSRDHLGEALLASANGKRLVKLGYRADVEYCGRTNLLELVPVLHNGLLVAEGCASRR
ncbi:MAG: 2-phosphosulfolactate phosphatase [Paenibacillaceae bacterium]|jgi:2-phosphosulfolactate phosphatase|nr:2-phosphosulfolactate phosphatase [Paenibacillaceae bacterium]